MKCKQRTGDFPPSITKAANVAAGSSTASGFKVTGWPLMACIYLVFIQPVILFVIPLIRYDENRLPGLEEVYMLSLSARAWRDVIVTGYGVVIGRFLWRSRPDGLRLINRYLCFSIFSSLGLLIPLFVIPFHSYLRREVRMELGVSFLQTLVIFAIGFAFYRSSSRVRAFYSGPTVDAKSSPLPAAFGLRDALTAPATCLVGVTLVVAAFWTKPVDIFEAAWEGDLIAVERFIRDGVDVNVETSRAYVPLHLARTREIAGFLISSRSKLERTYLFSDDDLKDFPSLMRKLRAASDSVSIYLFSQLSKTLQQDLTVGRRSWQDLRSALVDDLNRILRKRSLFLESGSFGALSPSVRTMKLKAGSPAGVEEVELNRLLLEDAYPNEIARCAVDVRNDIRETPLHAASFDGRLGVSLVLLDQGAYVNAQNKYGLTPLDRAYLGKANHRRGDFDAVIALLISKGGKANSPDFSTPDNALLSQGGWAACLHWSFWSHFFA